MKVNDIRNGFLSYFKNNDHLVMPSSPVVPNNDPTILFTNAGMVQFKSYFTGEQTAQHPRMATAQKCIRAGGKHNDLDNVGYTARHHTFFEMLGNFSFGDYFKEQAILHAWTLLTKDFALSPEKLLVTVYHTDEEARNLWKKMAGLSDDKIIGIASQDNFWSMGDTGPCGPCSEIFYDHGAHVAGGPPGSKDEDGDRFIEIWNLVFMQYEKQANGDMTNLPRPCIDTGMGIERFAAILQGKENNFDIDLFASILNTSASLTNKPLSGSYLFSHRILADHLRSSSFLIADGVLPSNEGRGYVLRRIMRRAMLHAHFLGAQEPLMYRLFPSLQQEMGGHFKELISQEKLINETLKAEEERFLTTLEKGLDLLHSEINKMGTNSVLDGKIAFTLYDTYGFPIDLTEDILKKENKTIDHTSFQEAMQEQKNRGKASWKGNKKDTDLKTLSEILAQHGDTTFNGYDTQEHKTQIIALVAHGESANTAKEGDNILIITPETCFYPEQGGQVGDQGHIISATGKIDIIDTQKHHGLIFHAGLVVEGSVSVRDAAHLYVNQKKRSASMANHTATHLLNAALRHFVGEHVIQKGSYVSPEGLRFDFSSNAPVASEILIKIENYINDIVQSRAPVSTKVTPYAQAIEEGALSLPGASYDQDVRTVSVVTSNNEKQHLYSKELCGGTHVQNTQEIMAFKILSEASVAAGIRRIEAITGAKAIESLFQQSRTLDQIKRTTGQKEENLHDFITKNIEQLKVMRKDNLQLINKLVRAGHPDYVRYQHETLHTSAHEVNLHIYNLKEPLDDIKGLLDSLIKKVQHQSIIFMSYTIEEKVNIAVGVTKDISTDINASSILKTALSPLNGKGGGKAEFAMGSGQNIPNGLQQGIESIKTFISNIS